MGNENLTPQLNELNIKPSGNPLQLKGLMDTMSSVYTQGMSFDDFQTKVGMIIKKQLEDTLLTMDSTNSQTIMNFLQDVDNSLSLSNNQIIRNNEFSK